MNNSAIGLEHITKDYAISTMIVCFDIRYFPHGPGVDFFSSYETREEALNVIKDILTKNGLDAEKEIKNFQDEYYHKIIL